MLFRSIVQAYPLAKIDVVQKIMAQFMGQNGQACRFVMDVLLIDDDGDVSVFKGGVISPGIMSDPAVLDVRRAMGDVQTGGHLAGMAGHFSGGFIDVYTH